MLTNYFKSIKYNFCMFTKLKIPQIITELDAVAVKVRPCIIKKYVEQ